MNKKIYRSKNGQFASQPKIVAGRLYEYNGTIVRAGKTCSNNYRHVSFHKTLHGFVKDCELKKIDKSAVENYLGNA